MRMPPRFGLRTRFMLALLTVVAVPSLGFYLAVGQFTRTLEAELLDARLEEEVEEFANAFRLDPRAQPPDYAGLSGYVVHAGEPSAAPPAVLALPPGLHRQVLLDGAEYYVGRRDLGGTRLYVVLDTQPVRELKVRLETLAATTIGVAVVLAALVAVGLARLVTRPVTQLADTVARLDPRQRRVTLSANFGDYEVGVIAAAFDRYLERLDEFVQRERAFTEDASHELRTPLAVVRSAVQLLLDDPGLSSAVRERVLRIERACAQMHELTEGLLVLAREEQASQYTPCPLEEVVREAVNARQDAARAKGIELRLTAAEPQRVRATAGLAAAVVSNLVGNAVHHTERGMVEVRLERGRLTVTDTGSGIAAEDLPRVFERRYRGSLSAGHGLGLYIVRRICDQLGWGVQIQSVLKRGTRVEVAFPVIG